MQEKMINPNLDPKVAELLTPQEVELKTCSMCKKNLPNTSDYYHQDASRDDGRKSICKGCRKRYEMAVESDDHSEEIRKFNYKLIKQIGNYAQGVDRLTGRRENIGKLYEAIMDAFGGSQQFGAIVATTFAMSSDQVKQKIISQVLHMSRHVTELGLAEKDLASLSHEELLQEFEQVSRGAGLGNIADEMRVRLRLMEGREPTIIDVTPDGQGSVEDFANSPEDSEDSIEDLLGDL